MPPLSLTFFFSLFLKKLFNIDVLLQKTLYDKEEHFLAGKYSPDKISSSFKSALPD